FAAVRAARAADRLPPERLDRLLVRGQALLDADEAERLARSPGDLRRAGLERLLALHALPEAALGEFLSSPRWAGQRGELLAYGRREGRHRALLAAAGGGAFVGDLRRAWKPPLDASTADLVLGAQGQAEGQARRDLLAWLADLDDDRIDGALLPLLAHGGPA